MSTGWRRPVGAALVVVTVGIAIAGCSEASGALVSLDEPGNAVCTPGDSAGRAVFGVSLLENTTDLDATITAARLVDAEDASLLGLELRAADDAEAAVVGLDYEEFGPDAFTEGQIVAAGAPVIVLVGIQAASGGEGAAAAVEIDYFLGDSETTGSVSTQIPMRVIPRGAVCDGG